MPQVCFSCDMSCCCGGAAGQAEMKQTLWERRFSDWAPKMGWKQGGSSNNWQSACQQLSDSELHAMKKGTPSQKGVLQVVRAEIRLWYFCGQTKNRRSLHCGDFHFGTSKHYRCRSYHLNRIDFDTLVAR